MKTENRRIVALDAAICNLTFALLERVRRHFERLGPKVRIALFPSHGLNFEITRDKTVPFGRVRVFIRPVGWPEECYLSARFDQYVGDQHPWAANQVALYHRPFFGLKPSELWVKSPKDQELVASISRGISWNFDVACFAGGRGGLCAFTPKSDDSPNFTPTATTRT